MKILAIETSTPEAGLALLDNEGGDIVWRAEFTSDRAHNAAIFAPLEEVLNGPEAHGLEAVVVGTGPGSYSGVRVGIAVANGISLARGVPCFGLSSLIALSESVDYRVIGDARRGEFFLIDVGAGEVQGEAMIMSRESLEESLTEGDAERSVFTLEQSVVEKFAEFGAALARPDAAMLVRRAAELGGAERSRLAEAPLEPIYLRAPHITVAKKKMGH